MKEIALTKGYVTQVDDEDCEWLMQWKWRVFLGKRSGPYARRDSNRRFIWMHREILSRKLGRPLSSEEHVDHGDIDGLNNRRGNLRLATEAQNHFNRSQQKNNQSGFMGVSWHKRHKKWQAQIQKDGRRYTLGFFDDPVKAAHAYDDAARELHGRFASTNFLW
jgi:AP2 domain/HNH endonuclease